MGIKNVGYFKYFYIFDSSKRVFNVLFINLYSCIFVYSLFLRIEILMVGGRIYIKIEDYNWYLNDNYVGYLLIFFF